MAPFRWQNCYADVAASQHDKTIRSYLDDVILPALSSLDHRICAIWVAGDGLGQADVGAPVIQLIFALCHVRYCRGMAVVPHRAEAGHKP